MAAAGFITAIIVRAPPTLEVVRPLIYVADSETDRPVSGGALGLGQAGVAVD